jgi:pimeloyl-ACP methyl ester carboxylesterase
LIEHGHQVLTPKLRTGDDGEGDAAGITLDDWVEDIVSTLPQGDDAVLVAHSFAGYVAAAVAERHPARVRRIIFLDATLPFPGKSWFDVAGPDVTDFMTAMASDGQIPWFSREQLDQLYPEHGISEADFAWMQSKLSAQPIGTYGEPAIERPLRSLRSTIAYVRCLNTAPPAADSSEFLDAESRTLGTGHWPMITDPAETARIILELADA